MKLTLTRCLDCGKHSTKTIKPDQIPVCIHCGSREFPEIRG